MSAANESLIAPIPLIRARLAANVREARRLRALLRVAMKAREDSQAVEKLRAEAVATLPCRTGVDHG